VEKKKTTIHRKETPVKKRDGGCEERKVEEVTDWYNRLVENRKNPIEANTDKDHPDKQLRKRKELKPLDFYISKIKKIIS
jgi:hypothetical protein